MSIENSAEQPPEDNNVLPNPEELENQPESISIESILEQYNLSDENDWAAVYDLLTKREETERAKAKIVDIFDPERVRGYHGTSAKDLHGILLNGILSRAEYEKKFGRPKTGRWTQQENDEISYWDLKGIRNFLGNGDQINTQILRYTDTADCFLILSDSVQKSSMMEDESSFYGVSLSRQPSEGLLSGQVEPEKIIGVVINIEDYEVFSEKVSGYRGFRMIPKIQPLLARKILVESALQSMPVYDLNGNLMWPHREIINDPEIKSDLPALTLDEFEELGTSEDPPNTETN